MPAFASDNTETTPWPQSAYVKASDPDTSNTAPGPYFNSGILQNGLLWTDKSVNKDAANIYDVTGATVDTVTADPLEFLVTLSALSDGYLVEISTEPLDVVFIIDLSGSMYQEVLADGTIRLTAMVAALNHSIDTIMNSNVENRVSVVGFGAGISNSTTGREPLSYNILSLARYSLPGDATNFFSVSGSGASTYLTVNPSLIGPAALSPSTHVYGGTATQMGMYAGAQVLMNNTDTTYTDPDTGITGPRQPIMILLTDGDPTFGWTDYETMVSANPGGYYHDWGDAVESDMGIDVLCVATASYWKQKVQDYYYSFYPGAVQYYTVGLGLDNASPHAPAMLDPAGGPSYGYNAAQVDSQFPAPPAAGTPYNMKDVLDAFVLPANVGTPIPFPVIDYYHYPNVAEGPTGIGLSRSMTQIVNDGTVTSYDYSDGFYAADDAAALDDAFKTITSSIIGSGSTVTAIPPGMSPDFSGYLTFSDVIGQYMEFKSMEGFWIWDPAAQQYVFYDGESFAQDLSNPASPNRAAFLDTLSRQLDDPPDLVAATAILNTSIAGGSLYYNSPTDYGNLLRWYADADKYYVGPYFNPDGTPAAVPAGARCIMDLYPIAGTATSTITGDPTDVLTISFAVLTALTAGNFADADDPAWSVPPRSLVAGQQIVRWYIPGSMIPMRTVQAVTGQLGETLAEIVEASPIRVVYSVGLPTTLTLAQVSPTYKSSHLLPAPNVFGSQALYTFFTNRWEDAQNITMVFCQISESNPYYFYTNNHGNVPVFVADGSGGFRLAIAGDTGPFYTTTSYFDINMPGYIVESYTPVTDQSIVVLSGVPFIPNGTPRAETSAYERAKTNNVTGSRPFVVQVSSVITAAVSPVQIRLLGNNGLLGIPVPPTPPIPPDPNDPPPPTPDIPPTGDSNNIMLIAVLLFCGVSATGLGLVGIRRKQVQ